jgi:Cu+-exporting ATPase
MTMTETDQMAHDPVCHMDIKIADAKGASDYNGMTYYFCSGGCKVEFDADPEAVLKAEGEHDHSKPAHM